MSNISSISPSKCFPLLLMVSANESMSSLGISSINKSEKPIIALRGVLSSWDIVARNVDLSLSLSSAVSFALIRSCISWRSLVISSLIATKFVISPDEFSIGEIVSLSQNISLFFFLLAISPFHVLPLLIVSHRFL